jgi:hypothetical protein
MGGYAMVAEIVERAPNYGAELRLTRVKVQVMEVLRRDGVIDRLGESRVYGNVYEAAADQIPDTST